MKVQTILEHYSDAALNQVSTDKVDEAVNLRLPRSVIIQEVSAALSSLTYVAKALAPTRPPTYAFLMLLLETPGYMLPVESFHDKVLQTTKEMALKAESGKELSPDKNYQLYLKLLRTAWEDDVLERSEAVLLQTLRETLGIWPQEHLLLEHHPDINSMADLSSALLSARNYLLVTGLVLTYENNYVLGEEVASQIRRVWGIDLENHSYKRLLDTFTKLQLHDVLEKAGLLLSGSKDEQIQRILNAFIPPSEVLDFLHIDELRELCRRNKSQISGLKAEVIANLIEHFDLGRDLETDTQIKEDDGLPAEPEKENWKKIFWANFFKISPMINCMICWRQVALKPAA